MYMNPYFQASLCAELEKVAALTAADKFFVDRLGYIAQKHGIEDLVNFGSRHPGLMGKVQKSVQNNLQGRRSELLQEIPRDVFNKGMMAASMDDPSMLKDIDISSLKNHTFVEGIRRMAARISPDNRKIFRDVIGNDAMLAQYAGSSPKDVAALNYLGKDKLINLLGMDSTAPAVAGRPTRPGRPTKPAAQPIDPVVVPPGPVETPKKKKKSGGGGGGGGGSIGYGTLAAAGLGTGIAGYGAYRYLNRDNK